MSPTVDPTLEPTQPTHFPTTVPTLNPSFEPTINPTIGHCTNVTLDINGFDEMSADDVRDSITIQETFANITEFAIAESALAYQVEHTSFYVDYFNVSGALSVLETLCAFTQEMLNILSTVVEYENHDIAAEIEDKLIISFLNETNLDTFNVSIYLTQFSPVENVEISKSLKMLKNSELTKVENDTMASGSRHPRPLRSS